MSRYGERIEELATRAAAERETYESPADPPDEERAMRYLREGFGPTVSVYLEARTGGSMVEFEAGEFRSLQRAMNDWLTVYARCYGVEFEADYTVRTAAELLVDTHDVRDAAVVMTHVP